MFWLIVVADLAVREAGGDAFFAVMARVCDEFDKVVVVSCYQRC